MRVVLQACVPFKSCSAALILMFSRGCTACFGVLFRCCCQKPVCSLVLGVAALLPETDRVVVPPHLCLILKLQTGHISYRGNGLLTTEDKSGAIKISRNAKHLGMIAGGSGITPMLQVMSFCSLQPSPAPSIASLSYVLSQARAGWALWEL